jgi:hypothetical protein
VDLDSASVVFAGDRVVNGTDTLLPHLKAFRPALGSRDRNFEGWLSVVVQEDISDCGMASSSLPLATSDNVSCRFDSDFEIDAGH